MKFSNRVTDMLGVEIPIIQAEGDAGKLFVTPDVADHATALHGRSDMIARARVI